MVLCNLDNFKDVFQLTVYAGTLKSVSEKNGTDLG